MRLLNGQIGSGSLFPVRAKMFVFLALVGCGGQPAATSPPPVTPEPLPSAGKSSTPPPVATQDTAPAPGASAGGPAASASAPQKVDVLLDSKLPPKVVSVGGSYSISVEDPQGLARGDIVASVEKVSKLVDGCLGDLFKAGGKKGKIAFSLVIDQKSKLKSSKMKTDDFQDKKLLRCIEGAIKKIEWSKPTEKEATFSVEWRIES